MDLRQKGKDSLRVRVALDLTPLIDVVFQLILFFMLSSTFIVQTSIPIQMPRAEGATNLEKKDISVTLLYEETNNLLAPILTHSLFNAANFFTLYFVQSRLDKLNG